MTDRPNRTPRVHAERYNRRENYRNTATIPAHYVWTEDDGTFSVVSPNGQRMETGHTDEAWAEQVARMYGGTNG